MAEIKASDFSNRKALEQYISAEFGRNFMANKEHIIKGDWKELKALGLSDTSMVWGVRCVASDISAERFKKLKKEK